MAVNRKRTPKSKAPIRKKRTPKPSAIDPTSTEALRALPPEYGEGPDMPVGIASAEFASLARLAYSVAPRLAHVGISVAQIDIQARFAVRLRACEAGWQKARSAVKLGTSERKQLEQAEALKRELLAGGRWALRKDPDAQGELSRIAEGADLADTIQDLRDLIDLWQEHRSELAHTDLSPKDLARAATLASALEKAVAKERDSLDAAAAIDLRNRCFWAADELASEIREAGRYAFREEPKIAAKFVSRYRADSSHRHRNKPTPPPATPV